MSRVRFPSPAPILSPNSDRRFCKQFCNLCSSFVELGDYRLGSGGSVYIASNDPSNVLLLPAHDLGNNALRETGDIEPRRRRPSKIVKMQVTLRNAGRDLRLVEGAAKAV